jgi:hypothetical protein
MVPSSSPDFSDHFSAFGGLPDNNGWPSTGRVEGATVALFVYPNQALNKRLCRGRVTSTTALDTADTPRLQRATIRFKKFTYRTLVYRTGRVTVDH